MVQGLAALGGVVIPYIPHRVTEGHGLRMAAIDELHDQGVNLIVTVDCGITDVEEVKHAAKLGMTVIITDHHTPPPVIPPAFAIVNPKLAGSKYPFNELAGVGVAYKVMQALMSSLGKEEHMDEPDGPGGHRHGGRYGAAGGRKPLSGQTRIEDPECCSAPGNKRNHYQGRVDSRQSGCRQHYLVSFSLVECLRTAGTCYCQL